MAYKDFIFKEVEIEYSGIVNFKELLTILKEFFKRYDYDINEKKYETKVNNDGLKTTTIKWDCDRKYTDYLEAVIKLSINMKNYKEGSAGGKRMVEGSLKFSISGEMNRDFGDKWKAAPSKTFIRAVFDKYVKNIKENNADTELKKTIKGLISEVKQYLQI